MKQFYTLFAMLFLSALSFGQIIFESNFDDWTSPNEPEAWLGTKTNFNSDSVEQSTNGPTFGAYLAKLTNVDGSHRRFTTQGITLMENQPYDVEVWVKGEGDIRTGLYDFDLDGNDFGFSYNSYENISSSSVISFVQSITPDTTYEACELILSVIGGIVEVDRVEIRIGEVQEPVAKTINEIQFTSNPDGDSPELGNFIITTGVVTGVAGDGYYIQDGDGAWNGIRVREFDNVPAIGDEVTVTGTVEEFFDFTRITDVTAFVNNGPSTLPNPVVVGTLALNDEAYEGVLVRTTGECTALWNDFQEWLISDGSGDIMVNDEMYEFEPTLGTNYQVTGPLNYAFSAFKIEPRDENDVTIVSGIEELEELSVSVYPNPVSDVIFIDHQENEGVLLQIYDLNGKLVLTSRLDMGRNNIDVSTVASGTYALMMTTDAKSYVTTIEVLR